MTLFSFSNLLGNSSPVVDSIRSSLEEKEGFWFSCLLIASAGVAIGCVLEIPETWSDLKEWSNRRKDGTNPLPGWRVPMAAIGLLLVILGVVGEGVFEALVSINETKLRAHDELVLADTVIQAGDAKTSAIGAANAATGAQVSSQKAQDASAAAIVASKNAMGLATDARKEADSYARDIAAAKQEAANAVSKLADAEQRLAESTRREAEAEAKLSAIKTPRSITSTKDVVAALKPFGGTEYTVSSFQDDESLQLLKKIVGLLHEAGWILKQPQQVPITSLFLPLLDSPRTGVPMCVSTGISIDIHTDSPSSLIGKPANTLPADVRAALTLMTVLTSNVSPPDPKNLDPGVLDPSPGKGPMNICIGKKP